MIRRHHYRCECGHYTEQHDESQMCVKCDCSEFRVDEQHEHDLYEQAQQQKYDEWKDRQDEED